MPNDLTPLLHMSKNGLPVAKSQYDSSGNLTIPVNTPIRSAGYKGRNPCADRKTLNIGREIRLGKISRMPCFRCI